MKSKRLLKLLALVTAIFLVSYVFLRKNSTLIRPHYQAVDIVVNPAGTCALTEYNFRGGERWHWADTYAWFVLAPGDAFYTITDIRTGKIIRDSTTQIIFSISANSQASVAMGNDVFYWRNDGGNANFPGGLSDDYFYEWRGIKECEGKEPQSEYANISCPIDGKSLLCEKLRGKL